MQGLLQVTGPPSHSGYHQEEEDGVRRGPRKGSRDGCCLTPSAWSEDEQGVSRFLHF